MLKYNTTKLGKRVLITPMNDLFCDHTLSFIVEEGN